MKLNFKESLQSDRSLGWYRNRRAFYLLLHRRGRRGGWCIDLQWMSCNTCSCFIWIFWNYTFCSRSKNSEMCQVCGRICVRVCAFHTCVHTHVQQSPLSTVFSHTMTAHSNPIKATQRASQHHSFICHSYCPPLSLSLSLPLLPVDGWVVTGWVSSITSSFFYRSVSPFRTLCRELRAQGERVLPGVMSRCLFG